MTKASQPPAIARGFRFPGLFILVALCLTRTAPLLALERVTLLESAKSIEIEGRLLKAPESWGPVLIDSAGVLWRVPPEKQVKRASDDRPFKAVTPPELAKQLLATLPAGFESYQTEHYVILHDTSKTYARWCGSLFERLHASFSSYWTRLGMPIAKPEFPLAAIVFADKRAYLKYAKPDLGDAGESVVAYYHLRDNRMVMYDLTGLEALKSIRGRAGKAPTVNELLSQPEAERAVATIVHEATHQIMFNSGIHQRYLDCPLWFSEGMAVYFESPDLGNSRGWGGAGKINDGRLADFRKYLKGRPADSLKTLVTADDRFRDTKTAISAYAEAWSLTYFLVKHRQKQYVAYMKALSQRDPMIEDSPEYRLKQFELAFGDWKQLDREFIRAMEKL
jgi:hypothetical protein